MAFRYRIKHVASGDAPNPDDWNLNMNELASEFNGYLDEDNLPADAIVATMLEDNTSDWSSSFNEIQSLTGHNSFELNMALTAWQSVDINGDTLASKEIDMAHDGFVLVEWSGWWQWDSLSTTGANQSGIQCRVTIDGTEVALSGLSGNLRLADATYIVGMLPVAAGKHIILVEAAAYRVAVTGVHDNIVPIGTAVGQASVEVKDNELVIQARWR